MIADLECIESDINDVWIVVFRHCCFQDCVSSPFDNSYQGTFSKIVLKLNNQN